ncbi:unnamed protein product [Timema podura]|uniref:DH domain-containing protein n=1 Tax=Timema podura TaxID=61482 RepID=A0ABN7NPA3_TIMPD|nr:unnamed protein product [Timema podura]
MNLFLFQSSEANSVSQAYHCYALNYINALNYLETLRRHVEFCEFEKWCNRDPRCKKLQLTDLLVAPVQHIMKVPLILKEVESRTEEPSERELITQILEVEENSIKLDWHTDDGEIESRLLTHSEIVLLKTAQLKGILPKLTANSNQRTHYPHLAHLHDSTETPALSATSWMVTDSNAGATHPHDDDQ